MYLILIRHGDAGAYTLPDHQRALSDLGQRQITQTAKWLQSRPYLANSQYIASPYRRAQESLTVLLDNLSAQAPITTYEHITPNDDPSVALQGLGGLTQDEIINQAGSLVVVCHMNIIAKMASLLTGEYPSGFELAEARVYELPFVATGQARWIDGFVPPLST